MINKAMKKLSSSINNVGKFLPIVTLTMFAGASLGHAAIITEQAELNPFGNLQSLTGLEHSVSQEQFISKTVTFDGFNSLFGTLTGVSLNITGSRFEQVTSFGVYNAKSGDVITSISKGTFNTDIDVMSDGNFEYDVNNSEKRSHNLAIKDDDHPYYNNFDLHPDDGLFRNNVEFFDINLNYDLSDYIFDGELSSQIVVDLNVSNWAEIMSVISPSEEIITYVSSGFLEMLFEVEYEFTPDRQNPSVVSEPSTAVLMSISLLGLGLYRRKLKRYS
jgi:hypothetical protein